MPKPHIPGAASAQARTQRLIERHSTDRANAQTRLDRYGEDDPMASAWKATIARTTGWIADLEPWLEG